MPPQNSGFSRVPVAFLPQLRIVPVSPFRAKVYKRQLVLLFKKMRHSKTHNNNRLTDSPGSQYSSTGILTELALPYLVIDVTCHIIQNAGYLKGCFIFGKDCFRKASPRTAGMIQVGKCSQQCFGGRGCLVALDETLSLFHLQFAIADSPQNVI